MRALLLAALSCALLASPPALAGSLRSLPPGFAARTAVSNLGPLVDSCSIDARRALVLSKTGRVFLIAPDRPPVLSLDLAAARALLVDGESGLMSCLADGADVWLYYSLRPHQVFSRWRLGGDGRIDARSETVLLTLPTSGRAFHTGSSLAWSHDGRRIFLARGDGSTCDPDGVADCALVQDPGSYDGKMLRLGRDGRGVPGNPMWEGAGESARSRVFAWGFRNPWTFAVVPGSDDLLVFDVGKNRMETVHRVSAGTQANWPCYEGTLDHSTAQASWNRRPQPVKCQNMLTPVNLSSVAYAMPHNGQGACIIGGAMLSGEHYPPAFAGRYVFADFVRGTVNIADPAFGNVMQFARATAISRIKLGPSGRVWFLSTDDGTVQELSFPSHTPSSPPPLPPPPSPPPSQTNCTNPTTRGTVPPLSPPFRPLMFATAPELGYTCTTSASLPCAIDGRMDGLREGGVRPASLMGRRFSRGFGVRGDSNVTIPLGAMCGSMWGFVGVDDSGSGTARVRFEVLVDGRSAFRSERRRRGGIAAYRVNLVGARSVSLVTRVLAPGEHDSFWADPILSCGPDSPYLPALSVRPLLRRFLTEPGRVVNVTANARHGVTGRDLCHTHTGQRFAPPGPSGGFEMPDHPGCIWYETQLEVADECGRKTWGIVSFAVPSRSALCASGR
ncbi:Sorbosone dehydrogenase-domain-containing protein [Hyaloraphidium curvatum]|nr:Sorbosone dehydrogenase-domain-containing protein [Hyaloraphidium curvatum]